MPLLVQFKGHDWVLTHLEVTTVSAYAWAISPDCRAQPHGRCTTTRVHRSQERVLDPQTLDFKTVLQIFGVQNGAARLHGRSHDERIEPGEVEAAANVQSM